MSEENEAWGTPVMTLRDHYDRSQERITALKTENARLRTCMERSYREGTRILYQDLYPDSPSMPSPPKIPPEGGP